MNEPPLGPRGLDVDADAFWQDHDLEALLVDTRVYCGPHDFAIDDLTDDEWDQFVVALEA